METLLINKALNEISELNKKKQFVLAEKKARTLLTLLKPDSDFEYKAIIETVIFLSEALSKSIKNLSAIEILENINQKYPFETRVLNVLHELYTKMKRTVNVESTLQTLLISEPSLFDKNIEIIMSYVNKKESLKAISEIKKLLASGFIQPNLHKLLVSLFEKEEIYSEKLEHVKILYEMFPDDPVLIIDQISTLINLKEYNKAFDILDAFINFKLENSEKDSDLLHLLDKFGEHYTRMGQYDLFNDYIITIFSDYKNLSDTLKIELQNIAKKYHLELLLNFIVLKDNSKNNLPLKIVLLPENLNFENVINNIQLIKTKANYKSKDFNLRVFILNNGFLKSIPKELTYPLMFYIEQD